MGRIEQIFILNILITHGNPEILCRLKTMDCVLATTTFFEIGVYKEIRVLPGTD